MEQTVLLFKALTDETRLRILALLLAEGELCVCDIIAALELPQSTISRHLAYLRKTRWVADRRCGVWMYYSIDQKRLDFDPDLLAYLKSRLRNIPAVKSDHSRLAGFCKDSNCA